MPCIKCSSSNLVRVSAKCSDAFSASCDKGSLEGYVPWELNIGSGDYLNFSYCGDCGQLQAAFPISLTDVFAPEDFD